MRGSLARFVLALACAASTAACAAVFGFDRLGGEGADAAVPIDGGSDTSTSADGEVPGDPCRDIGVPPKSPLDAGSGSTGTPVHLALKLFDFGIDSGARGLNLDRTCSDSVAQGSCKTTASDSAFKEYAQDIVGTNGMDNASYGLLRYLAYLGEAFRPDKVNERLGQGSFGFVLRVLDWNGTNDDDDIAVELFPTVGIALDPSADDPVPGGTPAFTNSDLWMRDERFRKAPGVDASRLRSTSGYVTGGRLVAAFDRATLPISVPDDEKPLDIIVQEGFVLGTLTKDGPGWRLADGVLAGRWQTLDALGQVRTIHLDDTLGLRNVDLCDPGAPTAIYNLVKTEICKGRDLRSTSAEDNKGLSCNAVSSGIRFDSYAVVEPGPFYTRPALTARCQLDGSVAEGDDCPPAP